jgi:hypothetical protein
MILGTTNTSPRYLQAHCQSRTSPSTDQSFVKELAKPTQDKIVFKKFPTLLKKIKNATHSRHSMTLKINTDNGLQGRTTRTTGYNSGFAKKRVQWLIEHSTSHQLLWYVDSFELRNPLLRKAANRYVQA